MYLILTTMLLTAVFCLKADAVKLPARAGILLLLVFCAAAVPTGGPDGANILMSQVQDILNFFAGRRQYSNEHVMKMLSWYR